ncbi:MAG TPA: hypothetical protein VEL79_14490, partial [Vicinamibacterales bacterium]|nr:hypothetical protein [Vicinamibacterales bacterium]
DGGARWTSLRQNMPPVPVRDVQVHPRDNDLIVATHGRGIYILDDVTPLQRISAALSTDAQLFDVRPATRWTVWNKDGNLGQAVWSAPNPPAGAILDYYLKSGQNGVVITITDTSGKLVRTIRNVPGAAGVNRTEWDLRYDPSTSSGQAGVTGGGRGGRGGRGGAPVEGAVQTEEPGRGGGRFGGGGGPLVLPGEYTVTLRAGGKEDRKTVSVEMDPRVPATAADLQAQLDAALPMRDLTSRANAAVDRANNLITQLTALQERVGRPGRARSGTSSAENDGATGGPRALQAPPQGPASNELATAVDAALTAVTKLRDDDLTRPYPNMGYRQYPRIREEITSLSGSISRSPNRPTDGETLRMKELTEELDRAVAALNRIQTDQIGKINDMMKNAPFIVTETIR